MIVDLSHCQFTSTGDGVGGGKGWGKKSLKFGSCNMRFYTVHPRISEEKQYIFPKECRIMCHKKKKVRFSIKLNKVQMTWTLKGPNRSVWPARVVDTQCSRGACITEWSPELEPWVTKSNCRPPKNVTRIWEGREVSNLRLMKVWRYFS